MILRQKELRRAVSCPVPGSAPQQSLSEWLDNQTPFTSFWARKTVSQRSRDSDTDVFPVGWGPAARGPGEVESSAAAPPAHLSPGSQATSLTPAVTKAWGEKKNLFQFLTGDCFMIPAGQQQAKRRPFSNSPVVPGHGVCVGGGTDSDFMWGWFASGRAVWSTSSQAWPSSAVSGDWSTPPHTSGQTIVLLCSVPRLSAVKRSVKLSHLRSCRNTHSLLSTWIRGTVLCALCSSDRKIQE